MAKDEFVICSKCEWQPSFPVNFGIKNLPDCPRCNGFMEGVQVK